MAQSRGTGQYNSRPMIFESWNYKILVMGLLMIIIGFSAMYLENEVNGFISLFISPILIMGGYISIIFAILKHDQIQPDNKDQSS